MRDLMRALATLGSLSSAQISDPGFAPLIDDTRTSLRGTIEAMSADAGVLGDTQARLQDMHRHIDGTVIALTRQVARLEDADMALVASQISLTQVLLQSSYRMISSYGDLSLAKFLT